MRTSGGCTLHDLAHQTSLSPSALRQQLTILERDGLIRKGLVRGRTGRPPIVYQLSPEPGPEVPQNYVTLLLTLLRAVREQGQDQVRRTVETVAASLAAEHQDIARIPDVEARIKAASAILFETSELENVTRTGRGYEVSLHICRLASVAREFPEICDITRRLLGALVGAEVEQRESILRGDPRCSFVLTTPVGHGPIMSGAA